MRKEKTLLIVNPAAGYNTGKKICSAVFNRLKKHFENLEMEFSDKPGRAVNLALEAADKGYELLISLGGDGTSFEVLNGIMKSSKKKKPALSFIPSGSGNSFLRDFDIDTAEEAIKHILSGTKRKIDFIKYEYRDKEARIQTAYFLNILGVGFVSRVAAMRLKYFRVFRSVGYTVGVLMQLIPLKRDKVIMIADGKKYELENNFISVSNSRFTGGKMLMAPQAKLDDGKLDIVMLNGAGRLELLKSFPKIFKGTHVDIDKVTTLQVKSVNISGEEPMPILVDGEVIGCTPLSAKVMPKILEVII